jgi:hypothetical protein
MAKKKSIVLTFGRFNPPTAGHHLLAQKVMELAAQAGAEHRIYGSRSHDPKKNPLDPKTKAGHMATVLGTPHVHVSDDIISPFHALKHVSDQGYHDVTVVTGSDRESIFDKVPHYQKKGDFKFKNFKVVTAGGERGEKAEGLAGMSATKQRAAASSGDFEAFRAGLPAHVGKAQARKLFRDVRKGMNLKEDYVSPSSFSYDEILEFAENENLLTETVSAQGRMRLARSARRTAKRRAFLRKLRKRRRRNITQLKKRASSQVKRTLRKRLFKGNWKKLSYAQRSKIDGAIDKRRPMLNRMVKQILPKVVSGETKRLAKLSRKSALKESPLMHLFNLLIEEKSQQEKRRNQNARKRKQRANDNATMQSNPFAGQVLIVQDENGDKMLIRKTSLQANHTILVAPDKMTQGAAQDLLQDEDFVNTPTSIELFGKVEGADSGKEKRNKKAEAQESERDQAVQAAAMPPKPPATRTTGKSTYPDSDHDAVELEYGVVAAFNAAMGMDIKNQIKQGLISPQAAERLQSSQTLGEAGQRTLAAISEQLSTNYPGANFVAVHYGSSKTEKLSKFWQNYGGVDNTPKSDILFRDLNSGQVVGVSVKCGPSQLMSGKAGGEATATIYAALETMDKKKLNPKVKKKVESLIKSLKNLVNSPRRTSGGDISTFLTGGELEGQDEDITKYDELHKKAKKQLGELLTESKDFRKSFVYEALTGAAKFDTGNPKKMSPAVAQYVLAMNKDGTETSLSAISPEYADKVAEGLSFVIRFKSTSVKTAETEAIRKKTGRKVYSYWSVISMVLNPKKIAKESFKHNQILKSLITEDAIPTLEANQILDGIQDEIGDDFYSLMQFLEVEPDYASTNDIDFTKYGKVESGFFNTIKIGDKEFEIPVEKDLGVTNPIQEFYISFAKNFISEKRNYRKEYDNYQGTKEQKRNRAKRNKVNRLMKRLGRIRKGDGRDVDHKDGNPKNNSMKNLRVVSKSHNRSKK